MHGLDLCVLAMPFYSQAIIVLQYPNCLLGSYRYINLINNIQKQE